MTTMINDRRGDASNGGQSTSVALDDDGMVPIYGFGDARSRDQTVISLTPPEGVPSAAMALQVCTSVCPQLFALN